MANVSPGVFTKIIDLSEYVRNVPSTIGFMCIVSEKGPDNQLIFTNARDFYVDFGEPNINYGGKSFGQGMYVASSFLRNSDSLFIIRVLPTSSDEKVNPSGGEPATIPVVPAAYSNLAFYGEVPGDYGLDATSSLYVRSEFGLNSEKECLTIVNQFDNINPPGMGSSDGALLFIGQGRGAWYNNYKISVTPHANTIRAAEGIYIFDIWKKQNALDWNPDTGQWEESFEIVQTFEVSFHPEKMDSSGDSMFVQDTVNKYFTDIIVYADRDRCRAMCESGTDWSIPFLDGPIRLQNGSDGDINDSAVATMLLARAYTGMLRRIKSLSEEEGAVASEEYVDEVLDTEDHYFTIVLDGGYPSDVKTAIWDLCRNLRKDCVGIIDNGDNKNVKDSLTKRRYTHTYNTFYLALYECYSKIYDKYVGRDIWVTPVYHMANVIPYTDNVAELWYAPAGFNRATLDDIKTIRFSPRLGERDQMYLEQINPIVKFNVGYTVWGQLTTQKRPTALQDLNIVRLVLYCKRALEQFCKFYIFELNDAYTWNAISSNIDKFLKVIKDKRGLYSYGVEVGATDYEIKAKQIHVNVTLNPTRVVEQIYLNFYIV